MCLVILSVCSFTPAVSTRSHTRDRGRLVFCASLKRQNVVWTLRDDLEGAFNLTRPPEHINTGSAGQVFMFLGLLTFEKERKTWWMYSLLNQMMFAMNCLQRWGPSTLLGEKSPKRWEPTEEGEAEMMHVEVCDRYSRLLGALSAQRPELKNSVSVWIVSIPIIWSYLCPDCTFICKWTNTRVVLISQKKSRHFPMLRTVLNTACWEILI